MKKALLFALALAVIPVAVDAQSRRARAEEGDAEAQFNLGLMYFWGNGVPENYVLDYMWSNLAAAQGDVGAQHNRSED